MVSDKPDFDGAAWEPFVSTKTVTKGGSVWVRYRDRAGKEVTASTGGQASGAVVVTAASAGTATLNMASPPASAVAAEAAAVADTESPDPKSDPGLFSPKPTFIFQPAAKP
jgi:hypothetical protein